MDRNVVIYILKLCFVYLILLPANVPPDRHASSHSYSPFLTFLFSPHSSDPPLSRLPHDRCNDLLVVVGGPGEIVQNMNYQEQCHGI
jgi:hypothetical protein